MRAPQSILPRHIRERITRLSIPTSPAYLRRFPLAWPKIDRSFMRGVGTDPGSASIVEAIIALARKLELDIVGEGLEHEA